MPKERDYIRRAAAALDSDRKQVGKSARRKLKAAEKDKTPEKP